MYLLCLGKNVYQLPIVLTMMNFDIFAACLTRRHFNSISDSEILPNNYLVFRRDVLIAVSDHIKAIPRESLQSESECIFI